MATTADSGVKAKQKSSSQPSRKRSRSPHDHTIPLPISQSTATAVNPEKKSRDETTTSTVLRRPRFAYFRLRQHSTNSNTKTSLSSHTSGPNTLDAVTTHLQLTAATTQFLGVHGAAQIPLDIMDVCGDEALVRIPADAQKAFAAAVGGWVSSTSTSTSASTLAGVTWRILGDGEAALGSVWDARAGVGRDGQHLFAQDHR